MKNPRAIGSLRLFLNWVLPWLLIAVPLLGLAEERSLLELKTAYLYSFTRYIDWPEPPKGSRFIIAVLGDRPLAQALRTLEREGRQAEGKPIAIRAIETATDIGDCQLLFVGASARDQLEPILAATAGRAVLLVGDSPGLAQGGVAINFYLRSDILDEGQRLRFEISRKAVADSGGIRVSSQLYEVARVLP